MKTEVVAIVTDFDNEKMYICILTQTTTVNSVKCAFLRDNKLYYCASIYMGVWLRLSCVRWGGGGGGGLMIKKVGNHCSRRNLLHSCPIYDSSHFKSPFWFDFSHKCKTFTKFCIILMKEKNLITNIWSKMTKEHQRVKYRDLYLLEHCPSALQHLQISYSVDWER